MEQDTPIINATLSYIPQGAFYSHPDITHTVEVPPVTQKDRSERLEQAIKDLRIGQRIHACKTISDRLETDKQFKVTLAEIEKKILS